MSRGSGSSVIPVAVFLAILLIVLPVSADNVTIPVTNTTTSPTNITTSPTSVTTSPTNVITSLTTVATILTTAIPTETTVAVTQPTAVVTTIQPTLSATETITTGSVNVYSSPTGASILIDGQYSGITPKTLNALDAGNHVLRLELSGYYNYEGSIYVVPGQTAEGYGTLQPMNQVMSAMPTPVPTTIPEIVPVVTVTPEPTEDTGLLGNTTVLVAIIGAITVLIATGVSVFIHLTPPGREAPTPPKKEEPTPPKKEEFTPPKKEEFTPPKKK